MPIFIISFCYYPEMKVYNPKPIQRSLDINSTIWESQKEPSEVFYEKGVPRNFTKFTGKHLWPATLLKKRLCHRCFSVNFVKFLRTPFLQDTS